MRYLKTLNIWDASIQDAIRSGQIKLQVGQWLTCGTNNKHKCRFVCASEDRFWVVHKKPRCAEHFKELVQVAKNRGYIS